MATRVETEITTGLALPSLVKEVSQRRINVYSGVKPRSIHSDEAWACQKGFRTCLTVHGVVKDKQPDNGATRVVVEVGVENQHGEKTAVGHASGPVR